MENTLFRKKALEKLSSPDNIHEMVQVTSSRSWLALIALAALMFAFIVWSIFGQIPKVVQGQGILIQSGGIAEVTLLGSGIVNQLLVEEGEFVKKDDTVAIVAQPELQLQIENAKEKLNYLKDKRDKFVSFNIESEQLQALYRQKYTMEEKVLELDKLRKQLEEQLTSAQYLLKQKNTTEDRVNQLKLRFVRVDRNDILLQNELQKIKNKILNLQAKSKPELEEIEQELNELRQNIDELNVKFTLSAYVKSPYEGKIVEIMTKKGQLIELGAPVVSIEITNQLSSDLQAIIYVSPDEGKKIEQNMVARISPSTVKVEEFGYIEGTVVKVSEYPSSKQGMMRVLGSADLVQTFSKTESPIAVTVKLNQSKTKSGYLWTSAQGPDMQIKPGTLCEANIIIQNQRPISLLLPFLR